MTSLSLSFRSSNGLKVSKYSQGEATQPARSKSEKASKSETSLTSFVADDSAGEATTSTGTNLLLLLLTFFLKLELYTV